MSGEIRAGGSWHTLTRGEIRRGGAWRTLTRGEVYKGGAWHQFITFLSTLSASASPGSVDGTANSLIPTTVTSGYVTVTPSGGLGPYTYAWAGSGITPTNPTSATSAFSASLAHGANLLTDAGCLVTDSLGATATATASVDLSNGA